MLKRLLFAAVLLVGIGALLPFLPGPPLVERLPRSSALYTQPFLLEVGRAPGKARVTAHLSRIGFRAAKAGEVGSGAYHLAARTWTIGLRPFSFADGDAPGGVHAVQLDAAGRVTSITDDAGRSLPRLRLEPIALDASGGEAHAVRDLLRLEDLPRHVIDAVLVAEDRRFFVHFGVDPVRVAGAALENVKERRIVEGASTLTQQLVKNVYLTSERTWSRKAKETLLSLWLEFRYSKREILEAYLNEVYLGQDGARAIHGVGPASRFWFGKDVDDIAVEEAALLAGMIRAPSALAPDRHPKRATERRDQVIDGLHAHGRITGEQHERARAAAISVRRRGPASPFAPRFAEAVAGRLREDHGDDAMTEDGLRVFTTLDPGLQAAAARAVAKEIARLEKGYPLLRRTKSPLQAALVAIDPHTGDVRAWVGGRSLQRGGFDRVRDARRQPGSVFKPVVALAAFGQRESGRPPFTLATILEDAPLELETKDDVWAPTNHDGRFRGAVTLRHALEESLNVPFARLGLEVGLVEVAETAQRMGIESPLRPLPSLSLGAFEVSPLEITAAYGVFPARGTHHAPRLIASLEDSGRRRAPPRARDHAAFEPRGVHLVTEALRGVVERGTGKTLRRLGVEGPVAGKTGTSNDFRDAWFIAYTPDLVVGAWVGFDDGKRVGLTGAKAALPIVARVLKAHPASARDHFEEPSGLERVEIDPSTGLRAAERCPGRAEVFVAGTAPRRTCPRPRFRPDRWLEDLLGRRDRRR